MTYKRTSLDANHSVICNELRQQGVSVVDLAKVGHSVPDLLIARRFVSILVEIKVPDGVFYIDQLRFLSTYRGLCGFATSSEECIQMLNCSKHWCLTAEQKDRMAMIVAKYENKSKAKHPQISVKLFERLMEEEV